MKARGTATDNLADVIQALQLVRKTGLLTVQRDAPGDISEVGTIVFREGQIIDAGVGQLRGADAFKKLLMWTLCHFIFEPVLPPSPPLTALPSPRSRSNGTEWRTMKELSDEHLSVSIVPYRSHYAQGVMPDFQRLGFSRAHRQLFLLIDGRRSTQELARLIGRRHQEVLAILADLESTGLIRQ
jgi:Domain of unknown function (DUF4388)